MQSEQFQVGYFTFNWFDYNNVVIISVAYNLDAHIIYVSHIYLTYYYNNIYSDYSPPTDESTDYSCNRTLTLYSVYSCYNPGQILSINHTLLSSYNLGI